MDVAVITDRSEPATREPFVPCPLIPIAPARRDGEVPRCRQCGKPCHANQGLAHGGAFDRFCDEHGDPRRRRVIRLTDWVAGAPFVVLPKRPPLPLVDPLLPDELRAAKRVLGLTSKELARVLGVNKFSVDKWLSGERRVSAATATAIRRLVAEAAS